MKHMIFLGAILSLGIVVEAKAAGCPSSNSAIRIVGIPGPGTGNELKQLLRGKTACKSNGSDWEWQEFHHAGGALIDYKKGPNDPVDPRAQVGTWDATGGKNAKAFYDYGGGLVYSYEVWRNGSTYDFCGGASSILGVILQQGNGPC